MPHNWIKKNLNIFKTAFDNKWQNETTDVLSDIVIMMSLPQILFSTIIQNPIQQYLRVFVEGTRAMLTSTLAYKNMSSIHYFMG